VKIFNGIAKVVEFTLMKNLPNFLAMFGQENDKVGWEKKH
jgi:hypothetical protein